MRNLVEIFWIGGIRNFSSPPTEFSMKDIGEETGFS
jgi:hypothetical protein